MSHCHGIAQSVGLDSCCHKRCLTPQELQEYLHEVRHISNMDKEPNRKARNNKAREDQQTITATKQELQALKSRTVKWSKDQDMRPGAGNKGSKYTSNKTPLLPSRSGCKNKCKTCQGKKAELLESIKCRCVSNHVITDINAYHADGKDNQQLQDIANRLQNRLQGHGLIWRNCLADTGYSSGENYAYLEQKRAGKLYTTHMEHIRADQRDLLITSKMTLL